MHCHFSHVGEKATEKAPLVREVDERGEQTAYSGGFGLQPAL